MLVYNSLSLSPSSGREAGEEVECDSHKCCEFGSKLIGSTLSASSELMFVMSFVPTEGGTLNMIFSVTNFYCLSQY